MSTPSSEDNGPNRTRGLALVSTREGRFEGVDLKLKQIHPDTNRLDITWQVGGLELESCWSICPTVGGLNWKDRLRNPSQKPVIVYRCLARFPFTPSHYELYRQERR